VNFTVEYQEIFLRCIRRELLTQEELDNNLLQLKILTVDEIDNSVPIQQKGERKHREPGVHFSKLPNVRVFGGFNTESLLNQNITNSYEKQSQFPHSGREDPFIVDLSEIRLINYIELHLFDGIEGDDSVNHSYSYYVETSIDQNSDYFRVIDHSNHICRSKQKIYFYPREVRFIKIVGTATYVNLNIVPDNEFLFVRSFSCQLLEDYFDISRNFWAPEERITDSNSGCHLAEGKNFPEGDIAWMLRPNSSENCYSYHQIGRRHKRNV